MSDPTDQPLKFYLLTRPGRIHEDTYSEVVVCAANEAEARRIHPAFDDATLAALRERMPTYDPWASGNSTWATDPDEVEVSLLGIADASVKPGIVLASFHAG